MNGPELADKRRSRGRLVASTNCAEVSSDLQDLQAETVDSAADAVEEDPSRMMQNTSMEPIPSTEPVAARGAAYWRALTFPQSLVRSFIVHGVILVALSILIAQVASKHQRDTWHCVTLEFVKQESDQKPQPVAVKIDRRRPGTLVRPTHPKETSQRPVQNPKQKQEITDTRKLEDIARRKTSTSDNAPKKAITTAKTITAAKAVIRSVQETERAKPEVRSPVELANRREQPPTRPFVNNIPGTFLPLESSKTSQSAKQPLKVASASPNVEVPSTLSGSIKSAGANADSSTLSSTAPTVANSTPKTISINPMQGNGLAAIMLQRQRPPIRFMYFSDSSIPKNCSSMTLSDHTSTIARFPSEKNDKFDVDSYIADVELGRAIYCLNRSCYAKLAGDRAEVQRLQTIKKEAAARSAEHLQKHVERIKDLPETSDALMNGAACDIMMGKEKDALSKVKQCLETQHNFDGAWPTSSLAVMMFAEGQYDGAKELAQRAIGICDGSEPEMAGEPVRHLGTRNDEKQTRKILCLEILSEIARAQGDQNQAKILRKQAEELDQNVPDGYWSQCLGHDLLGLGIEPPSVSLAHCLNSEHQAAQFVKTSKWQSFEDVTKIEVSHQSRTMNNFAIQPILAEFCTDGTIAESLIYKFDVNDGGVWQTVDVHEGPHYDKSNQKAFCDVSIALQLENQYLQKKLRAPNSYNFDQLHNNALKFATAAIPELLDHLKRTDPAARHLVSFSRDSFSATSNGKGASFCTYINLSLCHALLGNTNEAIKCLEQARKAAPEMPDTTEGTFQVANILICKGNFDQAKQLLYSTVHEPETAWASYSSAKENPPGDWGNYLSNEDREILSWMLIGALEKRAGNQQAYMAAKRKVEKYAPGTDTYTARYDWNRMGAQAMIFDTDTDWIAQESKAFAQYDLNHQPPKPQFKRQ